MSLHDFMEEQEYQKDTLSLSKFNYASDNKTILWRPRTYNVLELCSFWKKNKRRESKWTNRLYIRRIQHFRRNNKLSMIGHRQTYLRSVYNLYTISQLGVEEDVM